MNTREKEARVAVTYGDGSKAPPLISREALEMLRGCHLTASALRAKVPELAINVEADVSPTVARLVFHYADSPRLMPDAMKTVEINLNAGLPLDNADWLNRQVDLLAAKIKAGESDLVIAGDLDYVRLVDADGHTIFERGKAL